MDKVSSIIDLPAGSDPEASGGDCRMVEKTGYFSDRITLLRSVSFGRAGRINKIILPENIVLPKVNISFRP